MAIQTAPSFEALEKLKETRDDISAVLESGSGLI